MYIIISNTNNTPIYEQVVEQIKRQILEGNLKPDEALPSIRSLASDLKISVITIKNAYEKLDRDGFIYTVPSKGSFVSKMDTLGIKEVMRQELSEKIKKCCLDAKNCDISLDELIDILKEEYGRV